MDSILIGQIVNTHGIKGELKIFAYTDDLDNLTDLKDVYLDENLTQKCDIQSIKVHKNTLIVKFKIINDVNTAIQYKEKYVYIASSNLKKLDDDTYYIKDLIGLEVMDGNNNLLGIITYVYNTGANDVYEIKDINGKLLYLPVISQVVKKVDLDNKKVYVEIMDGLI